MADVINATLFNEWPGHLDESAYRGAATIVHSDDPERIMLMCWEGEITSTLAIGALVANCGRTLRRARWMISFADS